MTRITTPIVKFGHGSVAHGGDSRYWDRDDRRRDEDYNEDVYKKSSSDSDDESGKDHVSVGEKSPTKKSKNHLSKGSDHHGLYNEAGRDELKMYEKKYEASLKNVGQSGLESEGGNHVSDEGNPDMENEDTEVDDEYDDGIDSHDAHTDDYDDNRHETEVTSKLRKSHSEHSGNDLGKGHNSHVDYDSLDDSSSKQRSSDKVSGKTKQASSADARSNMSSGKQPKKHRKHRKFSCKCCIFLEVLI